MFFYITHRAIVINIYINSLIKSICRFKKPVGMEAVYHHWFDLYLQVICFRYLWLYGYYHLKIYMRYTWVLWLQQLQVLHSHSGWSETGHDNQDTQWSILEEYLYEDTD